MKLKEYLANAQLFPLMGVSQLNEIGEQLDDMLKLQHGLKTCGSIITKFVESDGTVSLEHQKLIAKYVYMQCQNKWDNLFKFAEEEVEPLVNKVSTTTTTYGKIVDESAGGSDSKVDTGKIAGFDSADFVDSNSNEHKTTYGRTNKASSTGTDTVKVEERTRQAEVLVDYTLKFWNQYGITRTVLADAENILTLPIYELEE